MFSPSPHLVMLALQSPLHCSLTHAKFTTPSTALLLLLLCCCSCVLQWVLTAASHADMSAQDVAEELDILLDHALAD